MRNKYHIQWALCITLLATIGCDNASKSNVANPQVKLDSLQDEIKKLEQALEMGSINGGCNDITFNEAAHLAYNAAMESCGAQYSQDANGAPPPNGRLGGLLVSSDLNAEIAAPGDYVQFAFCKSGVGDIYLAYRGVAAASQSLNTGNAFKRSRDEFSVQPTSLLNMRTALASQGFATQPAPAAVLASTIGADGARFFAQRCPIGSSEPLNVFASVSFHQDTLRSFLAQDQIGNVQNDVMFLIGLDNTERNNYCRLVLGLLDNDMTPLHQLFADSRANRKYLLERTFP